MSLQRQDAPKAFVMHCAPRRVGLIYIARKSAITFSIAGFADNGERICMIRVPRGNTNPNIIPAHRDGWVTETGRMYLTRCIECAYGYVIRIRPTSRGYESHAFTCLMILNPSASLEKPGFLLNTNASAPNGVQPTANIVRSDLRITKDNGRRDEKSHSLPPHPPTIRQILRPLRYYDPLNARRPLTPSIRRNYHQFDFQHARIFARGP